MVAGSPIHASAVDLVEGTGRLVNPSDHWQRKARSADEVAALLPNGARAFVHGAAATPTPLLDALSARDDLADVTLYHLHLAGPCAFVDRPTPGVLSHSLFTGPALRRPVEEGRAEFIPVFLSDIPVLFTSRRDRHRSFVRLRIGVIRQSFLVHRSSCLKRVEINKFCPEFPTV